MHKHVSPLGLAAIVSFSLTSCNTTGPSGFSMQSLKETEKALDQLSALGPQNPPRPKPAFTGNIGQLPESARLCQLLLASRTSTTKVTAFQNTMVNATHSSVADAKMSYSDVKIDGRGVLSFMENHAGGTKYLETGASYDEGWWRTGEVPLLKMDVIDGEVTEIGKPTKFKSSMSETIGRSWEVTAFVYESQGSTIAKRSVIVQRDNNVYRGTKIYTQKNSCISFYFPSKTDAEAFKRAWNALIHRLYP